MNHQDTVTGLVLLAFCALAYALTWRFTEVPAMLSQNVPPTFFPRLVLAAIAALSLALIVRGREPAKAAPRFTRAGWLTAGIVAGAGILSEWLGILATLGLTAAVLPLVWGERRRLRIAALAFGLPAALYLIFSVGLGVRFPAGRLLESLL